MAAFEQPCPPPSNCPIPMVEAKIDKLTEKSEAILIATTNIHHLQKELEEVRCEKESAHDNIWTRLGAIERDHVTRLDFSRLERSAVTKSEIIISGVLMSGVFLLLNYILSLIGVFKH